MTDWTPEEDEAFNEVEKHSNLGKQILRDIEGQPYHFEKREWAGLIRGVRVDGETVVITVKGGNDAARKLCGKLINEMEKNTWK